MSYSEEFMRKVRENNANFMLIKKKAEEKRLQEEALKLKLEQEKLRLIEDQERGKLLLLEQEKEKLRLSDKYESLSFMYLGSYVHGDKEVSQDKENISSPVCTLEECSVSNELVKQGSMVQESMCQEDFEVVGDEYEGNCCDAICDNVNDINGSFLVEQGDDRLTSGVFKLSLPVRLLNKEMGHMTVTGYLNGGSGLQQGLELSNKEKKKKRIRTHKYKGSLSFCEIGTYVYGPGDSINGEGGLSGSVKDGGSEPQQEVLPVKKKRVKYGRKERKERREMIERKKRYDQRNSMSQDYEKLGWLRSPRREDYNHITIRHFDDSLVVLGTKKYCRNVYGINPGLESLFASLVKIAKQYDAYMFKNLFFEFICENKQKGGMVGLAYLDCDDKRNVRTIEDMEAIYGFVRGGYLNNVSFQVGRFFLDIDLWYESFKKCIGMGPFEDDDDGNLYDTGRLFLSTDGFEEGCVIGRLKVCYDVEFFERRIDGCSPLECCKGESFVKVSCSEVALFEDDKGKEGGEKKEVKDGCKICFF